MRCNRLLFNTDFSTRAQIAAGLVGMAMAACGGSAPASKPLYPESGLVLLSIKDGALRGSASIGKDLVAVIVSDDGRMAYLADSAPGDVYAVSLPGLKVAWKQQLGGAPFGLLLRGARLFVSLFDGGGVLELDPKSGIRMGTHQVPQGAAALATDAGGHVVVAGTRGQLSVIDGGQVAAGHGFGVAMAGGRLWTADYERAEIVPAGDDHRVGLPLPLFPFWLASGAGDTLLITAEGAAEDSDAGGVFSFDPMTGAFKILGTPKDPDQVLQSGAMILVAAHGDGHVLVLQGESSSAWARGSSPVALATSDALGLLVVAVNARE